MVTRPEHSAWHTVVPLHEYNACSLILLRPPDHVSRQNSRVLRPKPSSYRYDAVRSYQRDSRNPRPPDPLAFWRRYSAYVTSVRFSSETDFCSFAILKASANEASIWL